MEMTREITLEYFQRSGSDTIFASGIITEDTSDIKSCINLSSVLTKLIHQANDCKAYASDLFHIWERVLMELNAKRCNITSYLFGFRENGVDDLEEVLEQESCGMYNSIYRMDVAIGSYNLYGEAYIRVSLYRVELKEDV